MLFSCDTYFKDVERMFYGYEEIDDKIEEILNRNIAPRDINSSIKTNFMRSSTEIQAIKKVDNKEIQRLEKERYVVEKTLQKYNNDYRQEIIKRRYFKREKNSIIYDSLGLWKQQYNNIIKDILNYAVAIAYKEGLIKI